MVNNNFTGITYPLSEEKKVQIGQLFNNYIKNYKTNT